MRRSIELSLDEHVAAGQLRLGNLGADLLDRLDRRGRAAPGAEERVPNARDRQTRRDREDFLQVVDERIAPLGEPEPSFLLIQPPER
ncbi:MAG TPA: hypothetical protein VKQ32_21910 [Polyangia bacterium]|nr:hypothetical protein [Polyangia bacterium]